MWTPTSRRQHSRDHLRYGSDLSDAEWEIIAAFMPPPARTGRPREWPMRETINHHLVMLDRERVGREASPSAAVIDRKTREDDRGWRPQGL
jgi:putative transposase